MAEYWVDISFKVTCKDVDVNKLKRMLKDNWNLRPGKDNLWVDEENFPVRYTNMEVYVNS